MHDARVARHNHPITFDPYLFDVNSCGSTLHKEQQAESLAIEDRDVAVISGGY